VLNRKADDGSRYYKHRLTELERHVAAKHVEVVGKLSHRYGVERGDWVVLEVVSMKQIMMAGMIGVRSG